MLSIGLVGQSVSNLAHLSVCLMSAVSVGGWVGQLVSESVDESVSQLVGWSVS